MHSHTRAWRGREVKLRRAMRGKGVRQTRSAETKPRSQHHGAHRGCTAWRARAPARTRRRHIYRSHKLHVCNQLNHSSAAAKRVVLTAGWSFSYTRRSQRSRESVLLATDNLMVRQDTYHVALDDRHFAPACRRVVSVAISCEGRAVRVMRLTSASFHSGSQPWLCPQPANESVARPHPATLDTSNSPVPSSRSATQHKRFVSFATALPAPGKGYSLSIESITPTSSLAPMLNTTETTARQSQRELALGLVASSGGRTSVSLCTEVVSVSRCAVAER